MTTSFATFGTDQARNRAALYCRVSTAEQTVLNQRVQLETLARDYRLRVTRVYEDVESGAVSQRPGLLQCLREAGQHFDVLLIWSIDRLSRAGVLPVIEILNALQSRSVRFISWKERFLDSSGPAGWAIVAMIAALAEIEREMIQERTRAGIHRARLAGKTLGRPRKIIDGARAAEMVSQGTTRIAVARHFGVSPRTIDRRIEAYQEARRIDASQQPLPVRPAAPPTPS